MTAQKVICPEIFRVPNDTKVVSQYSTVVLTVVRVTIAKYRK